MFDERRQRVTGIDKSYPLQPIASKNVSNNSGRQAKNTVIILYPIFPSPSVCLFPVALSPEYSEMPVMRVDFVKCI